MEPTKQGNLSKNQDKSYFDASTPTGYSPSMSASRGETALWLAVITQALMDAKSESQKPEAKQDKRMALRWLTGKTRDFEMVCYFAGRDPQDVRKKIIEALARNCRWRLETLCESIAAKHCPSASKRKFIEDPGIRSPIHKEFVYANAIACHA